MKRTIKHIIAGALGGIALSAAAPISAQTGGYDETSAEAAELEAAMAKLGEMFATEPLTAEQEARLPAASRIVALMIPEGTMGEIMGTMLDDMLGPMMEMGPPPSRMTVAQGLGVNRFELELTDEQAAELAGLFDPAWQERQAREMAVMPAIMREMMTAMEPPLRKAMSELYAIRFSDTELAEIEAFFSTETGRRYARESFAMASDPRTMSASLEALPMMMQRMEDIEARIEAATADLPAKRDYDALGAEERARISDLTGLSQEEIRANLAGSEPSGDGGDEAAAAAAAEEAG